MRIGTRFLTRLLLVLAIVALAANLGFAQRFDGTIRGQVLDATGAVVVGAKVSALNTATGVRSSIVETTSVGTYDFSNLLPGIYTVTVEAPGFLKYERQNVKVEAGLIAEVNLQLRVGAKGEVVEVTAGAQLVNTASSSITETFDRVYDMPIGGIGAPNVLDLTILLPNTAAVGGTASNSVSVGGNRDRFVNYTIDGADNNDITTTSRVQNVSPDAVQELVVSANVFTAEYGHSAGANFNVVTRTGTNSWHGGGRWYNENRHYNAMSNIDKQDPAATEPPRFDQQRVGGTIGGPVIKDKLFIFADYEWFNQGSTAQSVAALAPTAAGLTTLKGLAANSAVVGFLDKFPVAPAQTDSLLVNGTAVAVGSMSANAASFDVTKNLIINGDYIRGKNSIHTRYLDLRDRGPAYGPFPLTEFASNTTFSVKTAIFNVVSTLSPVWVNDFKVLYQRSLNAFPVPTEFAQFPNIGVDELNLTVGPDPNLPQSGAQNTMQVQESMAYAVGKWNLKWGVEYRKTIGPSIFAQRVRGDYDWDTLSNFINDIAPTIVRSKNFCGVTCQPGRMDFNQSAVYGYFQVDLRATRRLTLNMGARYEWNGTPAGVQDNALNATANAPGFTSFRNIPLMFGVPKSDKNNVSPRFGFAWDPTGSGKWSVRGGAMVAFDQFPGNFYLNQQPAQRSTFIFETGTTPTVGVTQDCLGVAFPIPTWCSGTHSNFLGSGGLLNVAPNIQSVSDARALTSQLMTDQIMPKVFQASVGVQHEIWKNGSVEVRYQFTRGLELPVQAQLNTVTAFDNGALPLPYYFTSSQIPAAGTLATMPTLAQYTAKTASVYGRPLSLTRGGPGFPAAITTFQPLGANRYHAVSVDYTQRLRWGWSGRANYTWARNFDDSTADLNVSGISQRRPQDILHLKDNWGKSGLNVTHKFALGMLYMVPKFQTDSKFLGGILHGWEYSLTTLAQSGQSATAYAGRDTNGNGDSAGDRAIFNPDGTTTVGTTTLRSFNFVCNTGTIQTTSAACGGSGSVVGYIAKDPTQIWLSTPAGVINNIAQRGTLDTLGLMVWNMSLAKNTYFGEKRYVQFRVDAFNVFNHRNFTFGRTGQSSVSYSTSGYSNTASTAFGDVHNLDGGNRAMQLGLRLVF